MFMMGRNMHLIGVEDLRRSMVLWGFLRGIDAEIGVHGV